MLRNDYDGTIIDENLMLLFKILYGSKPMRFIEAEKGQLTEDIIYPKMKQFIEDKQYGDAEDLLFEYALPENKEVLHTGLLFYYELNCLKDEELEEGDFTREEIKEGCKDLLDIYDVDWIE